MHVIEICIAGMQQRACSLSSLLPPSPWGCHHPTSREEVVCFGAPMSYHQPHNRLVHLAVSRLATINQHIFVRAHCMLTAEISTAVQVGSCSLGPYFLMCVHAIDHTLNRAQPEDWILSEWVRGVPFMGNHLCGPIVPILMQVFRLSHREQVY